MVEGCLTLCRWLLFNDLVSGVVVTWTTMIQLMSQFGHCLYVDIYNVVVLTFVE